MLETNNTPFAALGFEQWHPMGMTMAVVTARARVRMEGDGSQFLEPLESVVLADSFEGEPHGSDLVEVNDLIPFKPSADVTVRGSLWAPEPRRRLEASVRLGDIASTLRGTGPRRWAFEGRRWHLTEPEPIETLPLSWRLAAGGRVIGDPDGAADPWNPIGPGIIHPEFTPRTRDYAAPQIDSAEAPLPLDPTRPIRGRGFGALPPWWRDRQQFVGTYDDHWKDNVHPRLPEDFDYRHYQVAPPDLIVDHALRPGMMLELEGLWPGADEVHFALPDLVPFATFRFLDGREVRVRLTLDGVHADLTGELPRFDLTWRAWIDICPRFRGITLDLGTEAEAARLDLVTPCLEGVRTAA